MDIKQHMSFEEMHLQNPVPTEPKKHSAYLAYNLREATYFIELNTNWKRVARLEFTNGNETIRLVSGLDHLRGIKWDNIYYDYSIERFSKMDSDEFHYAYTHRLQKSPIMIKDNRG